MKGGRKGGGLSADLAMLRRGRDWRGRARTPRALIGDSADAGPEPFPTAWARSAPAGAVRNAVQRGVLKPFVWTRNKPVIEGVEGLESLRGPAVFVANHASHMDTPLIIGALPKRISNRLAVGAAADYFFASPTTGMTTALLFNAFPVDRYGTRRGGRGLASQLADEGWSLLLYPEGTRSVDGWMNAFKLGAARLCMDAGVPAVPVAVRGTFAAMPRGKFLPDTNGPRISVRFGRPMSPAQDESTSEFRNRLLRGVSALWAEEELGWYQAMRASAEGELALPEARESSLPVSRTPVEKGKPVSDWRKVWESTRPSPGPGGPRVWRGR